MDAKLSVASYTLALLSGICFVSGLVILSNEGRDHLWNDLSTY